MSSRKYLVTLNGQQHEAMLLKKQGTSVSFSVEGQHYDVDVAPVIKSFSSAGSAAPAISIPTPGTSSATSNPNQVCAPMPGIVVSVSVKTGQAVELGDTLMVIEAMKMENNIPSPKAGKIKELHVSQGDEVNNHQLLVSFEE
jgi:biotin carboxyl carrier protein